MFREKSTSSITATTGTNSSFHSLRKRASSLSLFSFSSKKRNIKKKQKRDVEETVTIGETYLIVHLCVNEIVKRGLTEPDIFNPVQTVNEKVQIRFLINCLLRDNRTEFEEQLKFQNVNNIIAGIRMALRNCTSVIISYENYKDFVRHEQEWQYDPKSRSFNNFLSQLPHKNQGILVELFDLFAMTMENSHINHVHPKQILKSMSLYLFNESQTETYEDFQTAHQDWSKYSNALTHLFLAYIRERSHSTKLPERLNILLKDYVDRREKCLKNCNISNDGREIIFKEHILPDITIENLNEAIISFIEDNPNPRSSLIKRNTKKFIRKNKRISRKIRNSIYIIPELFSLKRKENVKSFSSKIKVEDPETAEAKWDALQSGGSYLLSEEALKLLFTYDNLDCDSLKEIRKKSIRKNSDRYDISGPLESNNEPVDNNYYYNKNYDDRNIRWNDETLINGNMNNGSIDNENTEWDNFIKEGFLGNNSDIFSSTTTLGPFLSDNGRNSTNSNSTMTKYKNIILNNETKVRKKDPRFSCFKCRKSNYSVWDDFEYLEKVINVNESNLHDGNLHDNLIKSSQHDLERSVTSLEQIDQYFDEEQSYEKFQQTNYQYQDYQYQNYQYQNYRYRNNKQSWLSRQSEQSGQTIFERYSVIRGKELPYPLVPLRTSYQSSIPRSQSSLSKRQIRVAGQIPTSDIIEEIIEDNMQGIAESERIVSHLFQQS